MTRLGAAVLLALMPLTPAPAGGQPRPAPAPATPALTASRSVMAGSMVSVGVARPPERARLAIARIDDPASRAIVVVELAGRMAASLPAPGEAGLYELRLTRDQDGVPAIVLRQPLATTAPSATVSAPARVQRGKPVPVRGIGPNGEQDRVVIAAAGSPPEAAGPFFFPQENVESTLDAPEQPGTYELRYVMNAPLSGLRILARQAIAVD